MIKVGIDARFITSLPRRGIGNYSLNLIIHLLSIKSDFEFFIYIANLDHEDVLPQLPNVHYRLLKPNIYPIWENISLPIALYRDKIDILHCLGNTAPLFVNSNIKVIITIHDVMFLQTHQYLPKPQNIYQKLGKIYRKFIVPIVAKSADNIITVSNYSKYDILNFIPALKTSQIHVTYQSCDPVFIESKINRSNIDITGQKIITTPYILCFGAKDPRKNTVRVVKAYLSLLGRHKISHNLIIVGYTGWESSLAYDEVKKANRLDRVLFLNFIDNYYLAYLYKNATLFVYPSLYEGFGIPILEAFSSGCPVIASNVTSIPEVADDAALYFDPLNENQIANSMHLILTNDQLRATLINKGHQQARKFSWSESAHKTLSVYMHSLYGNDL